MTGVRFLLETLIGPLFLIALASVGCMLTAFWFAGNRVSIFWTWESERILCSLMACTSD